MKKNKPLQAARKALAEAEQSGDAAAIANARILVEMMEAEENRKTVIAQRETRFATWTPGLRMDGSRILIRHSDGTDQQLGIAVNGVLTGTLGAADGGH